MYYQALSIENIANLSNLGQDVMQSLQNMPSIDSAATPLTPSNFTGFNSGEALNTLSPKSFDFKLDTAITDFANQIGKEVTDMFNSLKGISLPSESTIESASTSLDQSLSKIQDQFSIESNNQVLSIFNVNETVESLGAINQSYKSIFDQAANISPKGIRDLNDSSNLMQKASQTTEQATQSIKQEVERQVAEQVQNKTFTQNSQNNLQQMSVPQFSGDNKNGFDLFVRLTVYWAKGSGTDKDSAAKRSSTGRQLAPGVTAAVVVGM